MGRNKNPRAGGEYDRFNNVGFRSNNTNTQEMLIEQMYIDKLTDLAASRFKWEGMPEEIDIRFLELTLFYNALSVFYHDGRYDKYMALRANTNGWLDYQNNPTAFNVVGNGNFVSVPVSAVNTGKVPGSSDLVIGKGIPIWANKMRKPDYDIVMIYAKKLANFDRTVEINSMNARMPKVIASTEATRLTWVNIARQIAEGQSMINVNGNVDMDDIKALDLGVDPVTILNLDIVRDRQWNKCMTLLGIESANQDKKERLVSDEVTANGDQTSMMRFVNLNERRAAAKRISDEYNITVTVDYYTDEERNALNLPSTKPPSEEDKDD